MKKINEIKNKIDKYLLCCEKLNIKYHKKNNYDTFYNRIFNKNIIKKIENEWKESIDICDKKWSEINFYYFSLLNFDTFIINNYYKAEIIINYNKNIINNFIYKYNYFTCLGGEKNYINIILCGREEIAYFLKDYIEYIT